MATIAIVALGHLGGVVHTIHVKQGTEFGTKLATLDRQFRLFMIFAIIASVAYHWTTGPLKPYPWLAAVADLRVLIFCGFAIRVTFPPFAGRLEDAGHHRPDARERRADEAGPVEESAYVLLIWAGVAISALIGVLKPARARSAEATPLTVGRP